MTAYLESAAGLMVPRNGHGPASGQAAAMADLYESTIADLRLQIQELGFLRLDGGSGDEFSRHDLGSIVAWCRAAYLKNPLVQRAVEIGALYVWGQDLTVDATDDTVQAVVDRFWKDNRATLTGQQASRSIEVELQVTGNVFLALFPDTITGTVRVRSVPMEEVKEIVCNPEDRTDVWYYRREWTERPVGGTPVTRKALYPDWHHRPASQPAGIGDLEVYWDTPFLHVRVGAFTHWRWGVPEVYAALDWARAYKEELEHDHTRSSALARFAWQVSTKGGRAGVAAVKARLQTTLGTANGTETNPPPVAGSAAVMGEGTTLDPIRIAGATLDPEHSRPARLMASAALGIPDHFFDADVGNFATSKTLDRPTELRFNERRQLWRDVLMDLIQWAIDRDLEATRGLLPQTITEEQREVQLSWPDLLERSVTERIQAVVDAATLSGRETAGTISEETVSRLLLVALGVEDVAGELGKIAVERAARAAKAAALAQQTQPNPDDEEAPADDEGDMSREAFVAALKDVREAAHAIVR